MVNAAEGIALANVATMGLFNIGVFDFFTKGSNYGTPNVLTLRELFKGNQAIGMKLGGGVATTPTIDIIMNNLRANGFKTVAGMVLIPAGFKIGKKVSSAARSKINQNILKPVGLNTLVKV